MVNSDLQFMISQRTTFMAIKKIASNYSQQRMKKKNIMYA